MLKEILREEAEESVDINLSPMIDCIFILLIFFILTTVFVQEDSILIGISADERVFYGGQEIGLSGVRATVHRIIISEDVSVIIQADQSASHGFFSKVYGEAKAAGAKRIHFSTDSVLQLTGG